MARNVLGDELETCGCDPMTGFYRTGCCDTGAEDMGVHTVCAVVTAEFLRFSAEAGNDLSTPRPEFGFAGLRPGDRWCLCASRWAEANAAGVAPPVVLAATHARTLEWVDVADLERTPHPERKSGLLVGCRRALGHHGDIAGIGEPVTGRARTPDRGHSASVG